MRHKGLRTVSDTSFLMSPGINAPSAADPHRLIYLLEQRPPGFRDAHFSVSTDGFVSVQRTNLRRWVSERVTLRRRLDVQHQQLRVGQTSGAKAPEGSVQARRLWERAWTCDLRLAQIPVAAHRQMKNLSQWKIISTVASRTRLRGSRSAALNAARGPAGAPEAKPKLPD